MSWAQAWEERAEELEEGPYGEEDYYNTPENVRVELIQGYLVYNLASLSRLHQTILGELSTAINNYIKSKGGACRVYPAPFAVKLREDRKTIVEPDISVICDRDKLTDRGCTGAPDWVVEIVSPSNPEHDYIKKYTFQDKIQVGIFEDLWIDFKELDLESGR